VILASAAPTICIALGTHLAALTFHRLTGVLADRRDSTETKAEPTLLTAREVAELLDVSPSTVSTWVDRGKLTPAGKDPRGRNLFNPESL
jgi:excisionase family DNA binding protein